jgi:hypothetical protein
LRSARQGLDSLLSEKNAVAGGFGELLDAGATSTASPINRLQNRREPASNARTPR